MTQELGEGLAGIARNRGALCGTHIGALRNEAEFSRHHFGASSIHRFSDLGLLSDRFLAVHTGYFLMKNLIFFVTRTSGSPTRRLNMALPVKGR
jgi:cytosine/adenosine deaminase-related metal-dependent hydrolase